MRHEQTRAWAFGIGIVLLITIVPYAYYRWSFNFDKRLRVVTEGKVYRSGCMTAEGFEETIKHHRIKTVINLMEEAPDPNLNSTYFRRPTKESELCEKLGVRFEFLEVDVLPPGASDDQQPAGVTKFRKLLDDPSVYPVLIHCKAGLHRTGVLTAFYRMDYEGWSRYRALEEMRALGFGRMASYAPNVYVRQYLVNHQPRAATEATIIPVSRSIK